eukprot:7200309-Karenia_brevis.AAC.1
MAKIQFLFEEEAASSSWVCKLCVDMTEEEQDAAKQRWREAEEEEEQESAEQEVCADGGAGPASSGSSRDRPCHLTHDGAIRTIMK